MTEQKEEEKILGGFSLTMITVSLVIGMGIFRTASDAALASASPAVFFSAWILGGIVAIFGGLTFAEIGARRPVTGAYYRIFADCYHPSVAFALNAVIILANAGALAGIALIGSDYLLAGLSSFMDTNPAWKTWIAGTSIIVFFGVNLLGLRMSSNTLNVLMLLKLLMLALIISGIFIAEGAEQTQVSTATTPGTVEFLKSLGLALVAVCFTYGGYQHTINFGGEVKKAGRMVPLSIAAGMTLVIVLYLGANYSYYHLIGFENLKQADGIASRVGEAIFGPAGRIVFALLLFVAAQSYVNIMLMTNPRILEAMATDPLFRKWFQSGSGSGNRQLYFFTFLTLVVLFFAGTFDRIMGFVMVLDSMGMAMGAATLFYYRKRSDQYEGFRMRAYPWPTIIFILAYVYIVVSISADQTQLALTGFLVFGCLAGLYLLLQKKSQSEVRP